jgi:hypothetical protein
MWLFIRTLKEGKGRPFYWLFLLIGAVLVAAEVVGRYFAHRFADSLPSWIVVLVAVVVFVPGLWWARRNDPAIRWVFDRLSRKPRS